MAGRETSPTAAVQIPGDAPDVEVEVEGKAESTDSQRTLTLKQLTVATNATSEQFSTKKFSPGKASLTSHVPVSGSPAQQFGKARVPRFGEWDEEPSGLDCFGTAYDDRKAALIQMPVWPAPQLKQPTVATKATSEQFSLMKFSPEKASLARHSRVRSSSAPPLRKGCVREFGAWRGNSLDDDYECFGSPPPSRGAHPPRHNSARTLLNSDFFGDNVWTRDFISGEDIYGGGYQTNTTNLSLSTGPIEKERVLRSGEWNEDPSQGDWFTTAYGGRKAAPYPTCVGSAPLRNSARTLLNSDFFGDNVWTRDFIGGEGIYGGGYQTNTTNLSLSTGPTEKEPEWTPKALQKRRRFSCWFR